VINSARLRRENIWGYVVRSWPSSELSSEWLEKDRDNLVYERRKALVIVGRHQTVTLTPLTLDCLFNGCQE
jgi:hypothetical protein